MVSALMNLLSLTDVQKFPEKRVGDYRKEMTFTIELLFCVFFLRLYHLICVSSSYIVYLLFIVYLSLLKCKLNRGITSVYPPF